MIPIEKLISREDRFFALLEASAAEALNSVRALRNYLAKPEARTELDEFIAARKREKAIATQITEALCTTFVSTLEPADIEALSQALYKIPKTVEKIAELVRLGPRFLEGIDLVTHMELLEKGAKTVGLMLRELRNGNHLERVAFHNDQLQAIEGDADKRLLHLLSLIYSEETGVVRAMFLKDIFELLEKIFDRCRDAGNVMMQMFLKNT